MSGTGAVRCSKVFIAVLVAIVAYGLALGSYGFDDLVFTQGDDATYYLVARSLDVFCDWAWGNPVNAAGLDDLKARYTAADVSYMLPYYSKPLFDLIYWGAFRLWGTGHHSIFYANLFFFGLAIWAIAWVGRELRGDGAGLATAVCLATSGSTLVYTRMGMAHMASLTLCIIGAFYYVRFAVVEGRKDRSLLLPGFFWGATLAVHPNLLPYIGMCGICELLRSYRIGFFMAGVRRSLWLIAGSALVAALIEAVYQGVGHIYGPVFDAMQHRYAIPFHSYIGQIQSHANLVLDGNITILEKVYTYVLLFVAHEGTLVFLLVVVATGWGLKSRDNRDLLVLVVLLWVPMAFFIFSKNQAVYRFQAGIVIPVALLVGISLERFLLNLAHRVAVSPVWVVSGGILLFAAVNFAHVQPLYATGSAWGEVAAWLQEHNEDRILSGVGERLWTVNGIKNVKLGSKEAAGIRYGACYLRYPQPGEASWLHGKFPVFTAQHSRPDKLLEVQFLRSSLLMQLLTKMPVVGNRIGELRQRALDLNAQHRFVVFETLRD
jgi:hypothetical protein